MAAAYKVLGVGSPIVDLLINVDDAFIDSIKGDKGGMELVSHEEQVEILNKADKDAAKVPGGCAGNTIFGLAKMGVKTSFLGKVGRDEEGLFYADRLASLGGDTKNFRYIDDVHTACCLSMITPDSERTMRTDLGAAARITPEDVQDEVFEGISHVHIEGYVMFASDFFQKVVETAKKCGCITSLDLSSFEVVNCNKTALPEILKNYIDIVFANEDEANVFCGEMPPEEQALKLNEYCDIAAVKLGAEGCVIAAGGKAVRVPTQAVKAVDTTGAGDLWQAGFLYGLLADQDMTTCAQYGALLGAEVVQIIGAEIPEERWTFIKEKLV